MKRNLLFFSLFGLFLATLPLQAHAATDAVVRTTAFPATAAVNAQVPVDIIIDTNGNNLQAAQVQLTFSSNLTYTSFDGSTSVFNTPFIDPRISGNTITISRGTLSTTPITGNNLEFVHLIFTLTAQGATSITFASTSPSTELVAPDSSDVSYTVTNTSGTIGVPPATPTPTPKPKATPKPTAKPTATPSATPTDTPTATPAPTDTPTATPVAIVRTTPTPTPTFTPTPTPTPSIAEPVAPPAAQTEKAVGTSLILFGLAVAVATIVANTRHH